MFLNGTILDMSQCSVNGRIQNLTHQFEDMFLFVFIDHFGLRAGQKKKQTTTHLAGVTTSDHRWPWKRGGSLSLSSSCLSPFLEHLVFYQGIQRSASNNSFTIGRIL
jgi:hypothetical protein